MYVYYSWFRLHYSMLLCANLPDDEFRRSSLKTLSASSVTTFSQYTLSRHAPTLTRNSPTLHVYRFFGPILLSICKYIVYIYIYTSFGYLLVRGDERKEEQRGKNVFCQIDFYAPPTNFDSAIRQYPSSQPPMKLGKIYSL